MTFKPIPGYPRYEINEEGVVRNINKQSALKPSSSGKYLFVSLGRGNQRYIHDLVMLTFVGPKHTECVRHLDGNHLNNCLTNLEYGSRIQNRHDTMRHGTWGWKLTERHVRVIRGLSKCGFTRTRLSELFGVTTKHISCIIRLKQWQHIT